MATTEMDPKALTLKTTHGVVLLSEAALALRVVFKLFGAEAGGTGFVKWLYDTTDVLVSPLRNVFSVGADSQYALDFTALFAMLGYMVVGLLVIHWANSWKAK